MINHRVKTICTIILSIAILFLSATFIIYKSISNNTSNDGVIVNITNSIPLYTDEELVSKSPTIIRGTVLSVSANKWNTKDEKEPVDVLENTIICKDNIIKISEVLKGTLPKGDTVRVRTYGGEYPQGEIIKKIDTADSYGKFSVGEDVILFLIPDDSNYNIEKAQDQFILQGMNQGKFLISDNKATNTHGSEDLQQLLDKIPQK